MNRVAAVRSAVWQRHGLVWPNGEGWSGLMAAAPDRAAAACFAHWQTLDAPLVVTRQPPDVAAHEIAVGLPAPARFLRRRLAARLPVAGIARIGRFPAARAITPHLPVTVRAAYEQVLARLDGVGVDVRTHGSYGWQTLTGESYVHPTSDLDLLLQADNAAQADAAARVLASTPFEHPRLDGELLFDEGAGIAWREWQRGRDGPGGTVLVKRIDGVALEPLERFGRPGDPPGPAP